MSSPAYHKAYQNTPEAKARRRERDSTPEARAKSRAAAKARYHRDAEAREKVKARSRAFYATPEGKASERARQQSPRGRFKKYQLGARSRRLVFDLTFEQFMTFWQKPCFYSGHAIETIGLDRVDNSLGYTLSNVVSCCAVCNVMKMAWPGDFFIAHCRQVFLNSDPLA